MPKLTKLEKLIYGKIKIEYINIRTAYGEYVEAAIFYQNRYLYVRFAPEVAKTMCKSDLDDYVFQLSLNAKTP